MPLTINPTAFAPPRESYWIWLLFTHKNGCGGANSETERRLVSSGGVNMTPGRLSPRREFTPVPSHGSIFVYMIPPQISCWRESPQREDVNYYYNIIGDELLLNFGAKFQR